MEFGTHCHRRSPTGLVDALNHVNGLDVVSRKVSRREGNTARRAELNQQKADGPGLHIGDRRNRARGHPTAVEPYRLPAHRPGNPLERAGNPTGNPSAVEAPGLRDNLLTVNCAPVHLRGHHRDRARDWRESGVWPRVGPCGLWGRPCCAYQVVICCPALPLAPRRTGCGTQDAVGKGVTRQVVRRGMTGLQPLDARVVEAIIWPPSSIVIAPVKSSNRGGRG